MYAHVNSPQVQLTARNGKTKDLLANLLKGYKQAKDAKFVRYAEKLEEDIDAGRGPHNIPNPSSNCNCILSMSFPKDLS